MIDVRIYDVLDKDAIPAMHCAILFAKDYVERTGFRNGVVYRHHGSVFYAYRTSSGRIVVRGAS